MSDDVITGRGLETNGHCSSWEDEETASDPALDALFDALGHRHRRLVLAHLREEPRASIGALARHVVSEERGTPPEAAPPPDRRGVTIALHHAHLPKLEDVGLIEYGGDGGDVTRSKRSDHVDALLDAAERLR